MLILGIESSCDETAIAIVEDGVNVLCSLVSSQIELHQPYGGVVPELASRHHLEALCPLYEEALRGSGLKISDMDGIAVTQGPGLMGALLTGFNFAKALSFASLLPCIGVNHLLAHIYSVFLEERESLPSFPFVALVVSGGHTGLYLVKSPLDAVLLGQTRDDAAGEAYDKFAKMMGLSYPGGALIDQMALRGNSEGISFPRAFLDKEAFDFSFSGLKSAASRFFIEDGGKTPPENIARAFQEAIIDVLVFKSFMALEKTACRDLLIAGGVAANQGLRQRAGEEAEKRAFNIYLPSLKFCGDNAAMIAGLGYHYLKAGKTLNMDADVFTRASEFL